MPNIQKPDPIKLGEPVTFAKTGAPTQLFLRRWNQLTNAVFGINTAITNSIIAGTGLSGGGQLLSGNVTINLADTAVTPATYGSTTNIPTFTVDQQGRITAASDARLDLEQFVIDELGDVETGFHPPVQDDLLQWELTQFSVTSLLLNFEDANGATTTTDESDFAHTVIAQGPARVSTAQALFGTASLEPNGGRFIAGDGAEYDINGSQFSMGGWFRFGATEPADCMLMGQWREDINQRAYRLWWENGAVNDTLRFEYSSNGTTRSTLLESADLSPLDATAWYFVGVDYDGTTYRLYLRKEGEAAQILDTDTGTYTFHDSTDQFSIGADGTNGDSFPGYIDNVKMDKGPALWAGDTSVIPSDSAAQTKTATNILRWVPKAISELGITAPDVSYDNTVSGLAATDVKAAIDEIAAGGGGGGGGGGGTWKFVETVEASASAFVDVTLPSTGLVKIVYEDVVPATDNVVLQMQLKNGGSLQNGATDYDFNRQRSFSGSTSRAFTSDTGGDAQAEIEQAYGSAAGEHGAGEIFIAGHTVSADFTIFSGWGVHAGQASGDFVEYAHAGRRNATGVHDEVRFTFSSGNITTGKFHVYSLVTSAAAAGGAWEHVASYTPSGGTITVPLPSGEDVIKLVGDNITYDTDSVELRARLSVGGVPVSANGSYKHTSYRHFGTGSGFSGDANAAAAATNSYMALGISNQGNAAAEESNFDLQVRGAADAARKTSIFGQVSSLNEFTQGLQHVTFQGFRDTAQVNDEVELFPESGNIDGGVVHVYKLLS